MAKIVLSPDAPDNQKLAATFGLVSFDAGKAKSYETDDATLLAEAARHPFFEIEGADEGVSKADAKAYLEGETRLSDAINAREEALPKLAPWETPLPAPISLDDLVDDEDQSKALSPTTEAKSASGGTE